jgi:hypothetical protein
MPKLWTRAFLTRRIDRCYLIAAGAKIAEKRKLYLERARHYRQILQTLANGSAPLQTA